MGTGRLLKGVGGGLLAGVATAVGVGIVAERKVVRIRQAAATKAGQLGALRGTPARVLTQDRIELYAEIDERAPYTDGAIPDDELTIVFAHGFALNLDSWHFQRELLRGKHRMVFYDQRSHGRSDRSERDHATIDQLGSDLRSVIEQLAPRGPVVLVGHSMGGMTAMALAEEHPDFFAGRVRGVVLLATTAGDFEPHNVLSQLIPDSLGTLVVPRIVAALAKAPELIDSARRGSNIGFLAAELFAFGGDAPPEQVEFLSEMLARTPFEVIAEFFPGFSEHDKYAALEQIGHVPAVVLCGTKDRLTSIDHSRRMAQHMPSARFVEVRGAGHMVTFEAPERVVDAIESVIPGA